MTSTYTTKLNLEKPATGDQNWGTALNRNFDKLDSAFDSVGIYEYSAQATYGSGEYVISVVDSQTMVFKSLQADNTGHALSDTTWWEEVPLGGGADEDNLSITKNSSDELQAVGVISQANNLIALKFYPITKAVWEARKLAGTLDPNTLYYIYDDTDLTLEILNALYPVGSLYVTRNNSCPLSTLLAGSTWVEDTSRVLVDKYVNGTSWWELYSDGWCEQGGITGLIADYGTATVNLIKSFVDTNYTITKATMMPSTSDDAAYNDATCIRYATRAVDSFQIYNRGSYDGGRYVNWRACGYTSTTTTYKVFRRTA